MYRLQGTLVSKIPKTNIGQVLKKNLLDNKINKNKNNNETF